MDHHLKNVRIFEAIPRVALNNSICNNPLPHLVPRLVEDDFREWKKKRSTRRFKNSGRLNRTWIHKSFVWRSLKQAPSAKGRLAGPELRRLAPNLIYLYKLPVFGAVTPRHVMLASGFGWRVTVATGNPFIAQYTCHHIDRYQEHKSSDDIIPSEFESSPREERGSHPGIAPRIRNRGYVTPTGTLNPHRSLADGGHEYFVGVETGCNADRGRAALLGSGGNKIDAGALGNIPRPRWNLDPELPPEAAVESSPRNEENRQLHEF
ncbi:hypothetical protein DFH09DRAFT_1089016 [Mycena vulgaris]|nr:hypothetical protein DFH09DRAFT_1089016 [Mycena vulgaris]